MSVPPAGTPVGFEIPAKDVARGAAFYTEVFGWTFSASTHGFPPDKLMSFKVPGGIFPVGGAIRKVESVAANVGVPKIYLLVDNIEATQASIEKNGGKQISKVLAEGDIGYFQFVEDSEGNGFAIYAYQK